MAEEKLPNLVLKCEEVQAKLSAFSEGKLPQEEHLAITFHLANCAACRELAQAAFEESRETNEL